MQYFESSVARAIIHCLTINQIILACAFLWSWGHTWIDFLNTDLIYVLVFFALGNGDRWVVTHGGEEQGINIKGRKRDNCPFRLTQPAIR